MVVIIMRIVNSSEIVNAVEKLCIESNYFLGNDVYDSLVKAREQEESCLGREIINDLIENADMAAKNKTAICQDTGMVVAFVEIGQDVHISGININDAINEGIRRGYKNGFLRKSIVSDPLERINTNDNTPGVINYEITEGDKIKIVIAPKGFGSENTSTVKMLKPSDGRKGVVDFILTHISTVGANPCPPMVVGIGIGGTMEKAALLAKKSLLRELGKPNINVFYEELEKELLTGINNLGIGPGGLGGRMTALAVNIETYPTHIAGLPIAINTCCHVLRHKEIIL